LKSYKFTIAFENTYQVGYTTEKLWQPFLANSIPIYCGDPNVTRDFNPKAFINCNDYDNFDDVIKRVIELDSDDELYMQMLRENPLNEPQRENSNDKIRKFLAVILKKGNKPFYRDELGYSVASMMIRKHRDAIKIGLFFYKFKYYLYSILSSISPTSSAKLKFKDKAEVYKWKVISAEFFGVKTGWLQEKKNAS
jgi:hypothetical protein